MKRTIPFLILMQVSLIQYGQIIADHTVVDKFDDIPEQWIDAVKRMSFVIAGESHSWAYLQGLMTLETANPVYNVNLSSYPSQGYSTTYLRICRAWWGDIDHVTGWVGEYGEEDWFTSALAITRTKSGLSYCNTNGYPISATGFGWCYDAEAGTTSPGIDPVYGVHWHGNSIGSPEGDKGWGLDAGDYSLTGNSVSMDSYINATQAYIDYCKLNSIPTTVFFTTGPVDAYANSELGYQAYLKWERLRDYVDTKTDVVFFDYADILCYDDNGTLSTNTWNGHTYPHITATNLGAGNIGHIGEEGALRLAKALWWMMARIAGWDGDTTTRSPYYEENTAPELIITIESNRILVNTSDKYLNGRIFLHNTSGHLVDTKYIRDNVNIFNTSLLSPGLYFFVLTKDNKQEVRKLILLNKVSRIY
jgi:hypothetical protein